MACTMDMISKDFDGTAKFSEYFLSFFRFPDFLILSDANTLSSIVRVCAGKRTHWYTFTFRLFIGLLFDFSVVRISLLVGLLSLVLDLS